MASVVTARDSGSLQCNSSLADLTADDAPETRRAGVNAPLDNSARGLMIYTDEMLSYMYTRVLIGSLFSAPRKLWIGNFLINVGADED